jgi:hypothetical protein
MSDLLTIEDLATMWRCSARHARDVLVKMRGFPDPAPGSTPRNRVWLAEKVRDFARGQPANSPHMGREAA